MVQAFKNLQTHWKGINWAATLKACNEFFKQGASCLLSYSGMVLIHKFRNQCCAFSPVVSSSRLGPGTYSFDVAYPFSALYFYPSIRNLTQCSREFNESDVPSPR